MIKLSTIHRRLTSSRRGRHLTAASCALAFATGYAGRSQAAKTASSKESPTASASHRRALPAVAPFSAPPPQHVLPTGDGSSKSLRLQGVQVKSQIENGRLVVSGLSGSLGGGRINASGRVDTSDKAGPQSIRAQFDDVDLREVMAALGVDIESAGMSGVRADGVVNLQWRGLNPESVQRSISGTATVKSGAGVIAENSPLLKRLGDAAGISDLGTLHFNASRIEASAQNGVLHIKSLVFQGDQFRLAAAGTIGLRNEQINLAMDVDVTEELAKRSRFYKLQSLASLFGQNKPEAGADGLVEVPRIVLAGNLRKPEVRMDTGARAGASETAGAAKSGKIAPLPEAPSFKSREVASRDAATDKKHVPVWRKVVSEFSDSAKTGSRSGQ